MKSRLQSKAEQECYIEAGVWCVCQFKRTALLNHHTPAERQTDAAARSFCSKERNEERLTILCRYGLTIVAHLQTDVAGDDIIRCDSQFHPLCSSLDGIFYQVNHHLA